MADEKVKELMQQLEQGILDIMDSEKYKAYLKMQSQFHSYSFNNTLLILMQRPDATMVAGYQTWKNKFDRHVMRGEKGIKIFAPCPYKYEKEVTVVDEITGAEKIEKVTVEGLKFKVVNVFDVKQTEGKPLPELCRELTGHSDNAAILIQAIKRISQVPIVEKDMSTGAKGYYSAMENIIAVKAGMSPDQTVKTLIHELAHSMLHNTNEAAMLDTATKEVQAESVAFIVSNRFGIDTSQYSFEYLASWSSGKDLKELKQSLDLIQNTANKIIEGLEKALNELTQEKDLVAENEKNISAKQVYDEIVNLYKSEFPAIKHISERTAMLINDLNKAHGSTLTIKDIKNMYKALGKNIELGNENADMDEFNLVKEIVDDIKHAQLQARREAARNMKEKAISAAMEASL